jgi:hypothetical protein
MMPSVTAAFRRAIVGVVLGGCSAGAGSAGPDGGPRTGPVPVDDFSDAVVKAICERAVDCSLYPDLATCVAANRDANIYPVNAADFVKSGVTQYDPVAAAACLDALPRKCWTRSDWLLEEQQFLDSAICRKVFKGTVAGSGPCCANIECVSESCGTTGCLRDPFVPVGGHCDPNAGLFCDYDLLCSPEGKCEALLPIGANCADQPWQQCEAPSACSSAATGSSMPGLCIVALPDEGERCDSTNPGACLRLDDYCDPFTDLCTRLLPVGAVCDGVRTLCVRYAGCISGVCASRPGLSDACSIEAPCIDGLSCVNGICAPSPAPTPTCQP